MTEYLLKNREKWEAVFDDSIQVLSACGVCPEDVYRAKASLMDENFIEYAPEDALDCVSLGVEAARSFILGLPSSRKTKQMIVLMGRLLGIYNSLKRSGFAS